jgi:DNA-binding PadR family transcriptional regulator
MTGKPRKAEDHLPLTPAVLHVLLALSDHERHGLGIMEEVEARTLGAVRLGPGTLYGTIKRMVTSGLIVEASERPAPEEDDTRRRYYALTVLGGQVLSLEAERLQQLVTVARDKEVLR